MAENIDIPKIKDLETYSYGDKLTMIIQGGHAPKEGEFDQTDNSRRLEKMQQTLEKMQQTLENMLQGLGNIMSAVDNIDAKMTTANEELESIKSDTSSIDAKIITPTN